MTNQAATAELAVAAPATGRLARLLGVIAVALALLSALATFLVLANLTPVRPTHEVVLAVLLVNAVTVLLLLEIIIWEVWRVFQARRRGRAGSRLHVRIVALFSVIAAVPAIIVAVVASVTLDRGLDRLFSEQTEKMIQNALIVAEAYLREQANVVRADTIAVAIELTRAKPAFDADREEFHKFVNFQATIRRLPAIIIFDRDANVVDRADVKLENQNFILPSRQALTTIKESEPQIGMFLDDHHVAGLIKLPGYADHYLFVARLLDPRVVSQLRATAEGVNQFTEIQAQRLGVQIAFALMYTVIALIVLFSAVWIGLNFANNLVAPIRRLIGAAQVVSTGNLHIQVPTRRSEGDLAQLGETFNKMTQELRTQRDDIVRARDVIELSPPLYRGGSGGRQRRCDRCRPRRADRHPQPLGRAIDRIHRGGGAPPAARGDRSGTLRAAHDRSLRHPAAGTGAGDHQSQRPRTQCFGARDPRAGGPIRPGLCGHAR